MYKKKIFSKWRPEPVYCAYVQTNKTFLSFIFSNNVDNANLTFTKYNESLTLKAPITTIVVCFVFCWLL